MTVSVEVEVGKRSDALVLPRASIRDLAGARPHVLVMTRGRAERIDVTIGIVGDERVEILEGVDETTQVIVSPPSTMAAGDRVRVEAVGS